MMFARSLGEFGATIVLAGNIPGITRTIPLAIYDYTSTPGGDSMALRLCLVSVALSFAVLLIGEAANRSLARRYSVSGFCCGFYAESFLRLALKHCSMVPSGTVQRKTEIL